MSAEKFFMNSKINMTEKIITYSFFENTSFYDTWIDKTKKPNFFRKNVLSENSLFVCDLMPVISGEQNKQLWRLSDKLKGENILFLMKQNKTWKTWTEENIQKEINTDELLEFLNFFSLIDNLSEKFWNKFRIQINYNLLYQKVLCHRNKVYVISSERVVALFENEFEFSFKDITETIPKDFLNFLNSDYSFIFDYYYDEEKKEIFVANLEHNKDYILSTIKQLKK